MSFWYRLKVRLGLADDWDDEEYYEDEYYDDAAEPEAEPPGRSYDRSSPYGSGAHPGAVRKLDRGPDLERARVGGANLRSISGAGTSAGAPQVKMHIVQPKAFTEAQSIADKFKVGTPVIMNLTMTSPELSKRLIDFASGLTYGLDGGLQKVSDKVFMLTPANVEVADVDRRRLKDTGFFPSE